MDRDRELFIVALFNRELRLLHILSILGIRDEVRFSMADVMRPAVCANASGIVLAHNHPSGDERPSTGDKRITNRLAIAADALGMTLLDHLIFGHGAPFSFRQKGLI